MRIINRDRFMQCPPGTLFAKATVDPRHPGEAVLEKGIYVKEKTLEPTDTYSGDWFYNNPLEPCLPLNNEEKTIWEAYTKGQRITVPLGIGERDGEFEHNDLFAVWEEEDISYLMGVLKNAIPYRHFTRPNVVITKDDLSHPLAPVLTYYTSDTNQPFGDIAGSGMSVMDDITDENNWERIIDLAVNMRKAAKSGFDVGGMSFYDEQRNKLIVGHRRGHIMAILFCYAQDRIVLIFENAKGHQYFVQYAAASFVLR